MHPAKPMRPFGRHGLQSGFCCALYTPRVSVPIGLQQASHRSNSQQRAAWLKLQPALYTNSATVQFGVLEAAEQRYLEEGWSAESWRGVAACFALAKACSKSWALPLWLCGAQLPSTSPDKEPPALSSSAPSIGTALWLLAVGAHPMLARDAVQLKVS